MCITIPPSEIILNKTIDKLPIMEYDYKKTKLRL